MPLSLPFLDYSVPEKYQKKIKVGQLVKIPFRSKEEFGVIFSLDSSSHEKDLKLKPLTELVFERPVLSQEQLQFLKDISEFYHVSLGFLLKTNLIPLQKRKLQKLQSTDQTIKDSTLRIKETARHKPELFIYKTKTEKSEVIIKELLDPVGQTLFLVPEVAAIERVKKMLPLNILEKVVEITSDLGNKEFFARWMQVWSGEKSIVLGTRTALFLPWFNLNKIIMDDEGNSNYKSWDMAPRFHTRDSALFLASNHCAKLKFLTHTPSIETYFFTQKKVYAGGDFNIKPINKAVQTVDMRAQRRQKNFSLLSYDLLEEYKKIKSGDVFFFINRRGSLSYVGCHDCGNVLKCPTCKLSLTFHQGTNTLACHYCNYSEIMPLQCKKCQGTNVNMYGAGTQLAEDLVKKITDKADRRAIIRIDGDEIDLKKLDQPGDKIIIGTQLAWTRLDWSKIKLFAFLDADSSLFIPEYKISENLWQQLRDAQFNLANDCELVIQTSHPEHLVFSSLFEPETFYSQQLEERRMLGYPPFKFLVKIVGGNIKEDVLHAETRKICAQLAELTKNNPDITIMGPWDASPLRHNGQYWQVILAKIKYDNYKKNTKLLVSKLPDSWKIDPNPNSILSFS